MDKLNSYFWIKFFYKLAHIVAVTLVIAGIVLGALLASEEGSAGIFFLIFFITILFVVIYYCSSMLFLSLCNNIFYIKDHVENQGNSNEIPQNQVEINNPPPISLQEENTPMEDECPNCFEKKKKSDKECSKCGYKF